MMFFLIGVGGRLLLWGAAGHLPDGLADQVREGAGAAGGHPVPGRGPDRGHDRGREHARVQVALRVGAGPLGDHLGQRLLGLDQGLQVLPAQRGRGDHHPDRLRPLTVRLGGSLVLGGVRKIAQ
jgi:hypothetical protein